MSDIIIYNKQGKVLRCVTAPPDMLEGQITENEYFIDGYADGLTQYIDVGTLSIVNIPDRPNNYSEFNWETKQWDTLADWLDKAKADAVKQINQAASQKILSKYPIYKQLNFARTDDAQVMYSWIDNIRNLSNIANANIETSATLEQINSIVDNFKTELGNIA